MSASRANTGVNYLLTSKASWKTEEELCVWFSSLVTTYSSQLSEKQIIKIEEEECSDGSCGGSEAAVQSDVCKNTPLCNTIKVRDGVINYECEYCHKLFKSRSLIVAHKLIHTREKPWKCEICLKSFKFKKMLTEHTSIHTDENGRREKGVKCQTCGKPFALQMYLQRHILRVHKAGTLFKCQTCGKSFGVKSDLSNHELSHTTEKPWKCDICQKCFRLKSILTEHTRTHSEKSFKCDLCGKSFALEKYLKKHSLRTHKTFKFQTSDLSKHELSHTTEKPWKCDICQKCFRFKSILTEHAHIHEKSEKSFKCDLCWKSFALEKHLKRHSLRNHKT